VWTDTDETILLTLILVIAVVGLFVYFLPTIIAKMRGHTDTWKIFWINLLFGWTVVGLIGCVVWACSSFDKPNPLPRPKHSNTGYPRF